MNGADIDYFPHAVGYALPEDPPCPAHIDLIELGAGPGGDGDDACTVDHAGAAVGICEKICQPIAFAHIAGDGADLLREQMGVGVIGQCKGVHLCAPAGQLLHNGSAQEAGGTCNEIFIVHTKTSSPKIEIQVLLIFHKYSILKEKTGNNRHLPRGCKKSNSDRRSVAVLCELF